MAREGSETAAQREGSLWQDKPVVQPGKPRCAWVVARVWRQRGIALGRHTHTHVWAAPDGPAASAERGGPTAHGEAAVSSREVYTTVVACQQGVVCFTADTHARAGLWAIPWQT